MSQPSGNGSATTDTGDGRTQAEGYPRPFGDRYILLKELGKGGMGQVFMAVAGRQDVERVCALKIIRTLDAAGRSPQELGRRFLDEARVVTKLSHENLVFVFDFGLHDGVPGHDGEHGYLAMEYLRGKTLTELWNRCASKQVGFTLGVSLFVVGEIAAGLAYAHDLPRFQLVHRDISPSNVVMSYTGGVKLIDFGLAKWNSKAAQTLTGVNWGKMSYMSPEQYLGREIDHRSDIYSLGILLWELLTGRQLFPNEAARKGTPSIAAPSRFNKTISKDLDRIVQKALAADPGDRFQSASAFNQALLQHMPKDAGKLELSRFLAKLFEADAAHEAEEEQRLLASAAELRNREAEQPADPDGKRKRTGEGPAAAVDDLVGSVLADRYLVRRKIGEGSMGRVYEGHHTGVGKRVAIKVPTRGERRKEALLQRFQREANAASQIGHPNIADVTDCGTTPTGDFFFVMEFVDGVDLARVIRRDGAMGLERTLLIAVQICRGLEAAHKAGIIHRDLKPSNLMLVRDRDDQELVKVLDFGVAKFLRSPIEPGVDPAPGDAAVGTPRYMAPEQIDAGNTVDFRVDIYALGGVLYAMLSGGHAPFESDSIEEVWRSKMTDDPTPLAAWRPDLPGALSALVMRCLARAAADRPHSMTALKAELLSVLEETRQAGSSTLEMHTPSETAQIDGMKKSPPTRAPRPRLRLATLGLGGAGLLALAGAWALGRSKPTEAPLPAVPAAPVIETTAMRSPRRPAAARPSDPPVSSRNPAGARPPVVKTARADRPGPAARPAARSAPTGDYPALLAETERLFRLGQVAQAEAAARKAAALRPTVEVYLLLGKIGLHRNQPQKAAAAYQEALRIDPDSARAAAGLAQARAERGN